jgi:hypothetical protein
VSGFPACTCQRLFNQTGACSLNNSIGLRAKHGVFGSDLVAPTVVDLGLPNPAPAAYVMQFNFVKLVSRGVSRYYDSGNTNPDYLAPLIAPLVQPCGAALEVRWSGSMDGIVEDVPFTPNFDALDGMRYMRFEATLYSNLFTGSRAHVAALAVPFLPR